MGAFSSALLAWFARDQRDMPWRLHARGLPAEGLTPDPAYAVWISEVMLQQTQVTTVRAYYLRFLTRFPTVTALAEASLDDVLAVWSGLGYYARARHLHRAARAIVADHAGMMPSTYDGLLSLPGVGPYSAAAVASIAFGRPHAVVDGNVTRVLARVSLERGDVTTLASKRRIQALADRLVAPDRPGDYNQALMELGATVCVPRSPACLLCPVTPVCRAAAADVQHEIPLKAKKLPVRQVELFVAVVTRDTPGGVQTLLVKRAENGLWGGLWELPSCPASGLARTTLARFLHDRLGLTATIGRRLGQYEHLLTHRRVRFLIYPAALQHEATPPPASPPQTWANSGDLVQLALSTAMRRVLDQVEGKRARNR